MSDQDLVRRLRAAGCVFAEEEARLLLAAAETPEQLKALTRRRVSGEPLEVIVGWAEFCGLRIAVSAGVFVPRQRTRLLAEQALSSVRPGAVVVDLCCGSGAVAAVVADRVPGLELHAADVDAAAVACAKGNLAGIAQVHEGDLYAALPGTLRGRVEVVVCNAPYVPTGAIALMPPEARLHEPTRTLDGGRDGLDVQRRVAAAASSWLAPGGHLLMETGESQLPGSVELCAAAGLSAWQVHSQELSATVVVARRTAGVH